MQKKKNRRTFDSQINWLQYNKQEHPSQIFSETLEVERKRIESRTKSNREPSEPRLICLLSDKF